MASNFPIWGQFSKPGAGPNLSVLPLVLRRSRATAKCTSRLDQTISQVGGTPPGLMGLILGSFKPQLHAKLQEFGHLSSNPKKKPGQSHEGTWIWGEGRSKLPNVSIPTQGAGLPLPEPFQKPQGTSGDSSSAASEVLGLAGDGSSSVPAREAAIPAGNTARPQAAASQIAPQGPEQEHSWISTPPPSCQASVRSNQALTEFISF